MSEPKHTPTLTLNRHGYVAHYACHEYLESPEGYVLAFWNYDGNAERTAFRDAILTAVNMHDELLAMARKYQAVLQMRSDARVITKSDREVLGELNALIAKAEGR